MPEQLIQERSVPAPSEARQTRTATKFGAIEGILVAALVIAFMTHMTGLATVVTPLANPVAMVIEYSVVAIYAIVALLRGHVGVVLAGVAWVVYLLMQCFVWQMVSGFPMNANAALSYGTLLFFIVFYETRLSVQSALRIVLIFAVAYVAIYALLWNQILAIAGRDSYIFLPSDGVRPARLYLAVPFASFTFVYGLLSLRRRPIAGIMLLLLSGYALWIAQTRFATVLLGVAVLAAVIGRVAVELKRIANISLALIFIAVSSASLAGFFVSDWNPYLAVTSDASGAARATEYEDGIYATSNHLLTGYGIADSVQNVQFFVHPRRPFYASDLGIAGLAMQYGIPMVLLLALMCVAFITIQPLASSQMNTLLWALFYATQQAAFSTIFANTLVGGPATMFGTIVFALWLRKRKAKNRQAPTL